MDIIHQRITIVKIQKPMRQNINEELQWFGNSLGLFGLRDKDQSCFRIFIELLKATKSKEGLTSDEIAYKLDLSRGTVMHHVNKMIDAGIVISHKNRYLLRGGKLQYIIEELRKDMERTFADIESASKEIDDEMGL